MSIGTDSFARPRPHPDPELAGRTALAGGFAPGAPHLGRRRRLEALERDSLVTGQEPSDQAQQPPPQQPPLACVLPALVAGMEELAPARAIIDSKRTVSFEPHAQTVARSISAAGRRRSNVSPHARQRYSYIGMGRTVPRCRAISSRDADVTTARQSGLNSRDGQRPWCCSASRSMPSRTRSRPTSNESPKS